MAIQVPMPKLGKAMKEGVVVKWLKEDGAQVKKEERIAVIMSKKITCEVQAPSSGILRHAALLMEAIPVGVPFAYITEPGEEIPAEVAAQPVADTAPAAETPALAAVKVKAEKPFAPASPAARRLAKEKGIDLAEVQGSGPEGRVVEKDIDRFLQEQSAREVAEPLATSSAKWMARKHGVDLTQVSGSGPGGRITEQDVENFLAAGSPIAAPVIPFSGIRQTVAEHMMDSLHQMAQLTVAAEVDVTELVKLRTQLKAEFNLTYTDLIIKIVAKALKQHPRLNATLIGDEIHLLSEVHIGIAVALEEGLIVPVVRDVDQKDLRTIAKETRRLAQSAREGTLSVDEVTGSTFTFTNLGMYGIDYSTPIINSPEAAILGGGRIVEKPAIYDGQIVKRLLMGLSLTFDHRLVDGAPAAEFLRTVGEILESPYRLLVD